MEKNNKSKIIYWLVGAVITLIGIIYGYLVFNQNETKSQLKIHEDNQNAWQMEDIWWKGSIDGRLANLEEAVGIDGIKK